MRTERTRVTPRTYQDTAGEWITDAAVDANTLYARPATKKEIEAAKNPPPDPDAGLAKPDSTTRVLGASLPPATNDDARANLKETVDAINIRDARKRDEAERYAKWIEQQTSEKPDTGKRAKPEPPPSL